MITSNTRMEQERLKFNIRSAIYQCDPGQVNPVIPHLQKADHNIYVRGASKVTQILTFLKMLLVT